MSRSYKTSDKVLLKKLKDARSGQRIIVLSALNRKGGAHTNRRDKRLSNAKNNWRKEWE